MIDQMEIQITTTDQDAIDRIEAQYHSLERIEMFGSLWVIVEICDEYNPSHSFTARLFSESK